MDPEPGLLAVGTAPSIQSGSQTVNKVGSKKNTLEDCIYNAQNVLALHILSLSEIKMVIVLVVSPAEVASTVKNSTAFSTVVSSKIVMFTH